MLPSDIYARLTFNYSGTPVPRGAATVLCARAFGGVTPFTRDHANVVLNGFEDNVIALLDDGILCTSLSVKVGPDDTGVSYEIASGFSGARAGQSTPPNVSFLCIKSSTLGGRRGKGRMFLPGVIEDDVTEGGVIDGGTVTGLNDGLQAFLDFIEGEATNPVQLCLEHEDSTHWVLVDGQPRRVPDEDTAPDPSVITGIVASNTVATQRRRLRG